MATDPLPPDPRAHPDFERILMGYVEALNLRGFVDPDDVRRDHPQLGAALLEDLETFVALQPAKAPEDPLGVLGDYTLRRQIGRGGMGVVYEAWQSSLERRVALKVLPAGVAADSRAFVRFMKEAKTAAQLNHPHVVGVYGMGVEQNTPYFAELVEGETLAQLLAKLKVLEPGAGTPFGRKDGAGYFESLALAFADVADGLQHAHARKVIHRDIKPSNLILDGEGRLRILDFGLARLEGEESLTQSGDLLGTPQYMSPEQARRKQIAVDHRTDVYSLGATLYEALCSRPPFQGKDQHDTLSQIIERDPVAPKRISPSLPHELETIVLKCLRKDAGDRYGTAEALGQDLRRFARGDAIEARPPTRWQAWFRLARRRWKPLTAAAGAVLALAVCGFLWRQQQQDAIARRTAAYNDGIVAASFRLLRCEWVLRQDLWIEELSGAFLPPTALHQLRSHAERVAEETVQLLSQLAVALPGRFEAYFVQGRGLQLLGRTDQACRALHQALARNPDFPPARCLLARASGRPPDASRPGPQEPEWSQLWVRAHPEVSRAEDEWLGGDAQQRRALAAAVAALDELIAYERRTGREIHLGSTVEHLLRRGLGQLALGDHVAAQLDFHEANVLSREHWRSFIEPRLLLAKAHALNSSDPAGRDRASRLLDEIVTEAKGSEEARIWAGGVAASIAWSLLGGRRLEDARQWAGKAIELQPDDLITQILLARALLQQSWQERTATGDKVSAVPPELEEQAQLLSSIAPENPRVLALLSSISQHHGLEAASQDFAARSIECVERSSLASQDSGSQEAEIVEQDGGRQGPASDPGLRGYFADARPVTELNSPYWELQPCISADGRCLYFGSLRPGRGEYDILVGLRAGSEGPFERVEPLDELNTSGRDLSTALTQDGLTILFWSNELLQTARRDRCFDASGNRVPFGPPTSLGAAINSGFWDCCPDLSDDALRVYFDSTRPGGQGNRDLYIGLRDRGDEPFARVERLAELSSTACDASPSISAADAVIFWSDNDSGSIRPGGRGSFDIWYALRDRSQEASAGRPSFGEPLNLASINTAAGEQHPDVAPDWPAAGSRLYFVRSLSGADTDIYEATWMSLED
jgi:tetratricopeptide (TPR) repeat protein